MTIGVILGSAFDQASVGGLALSPQRIDTPYGPAELHRARDAGQEAWVLFRHGAPHRFLPHHIPYRAHAAALEQVGCQALLITSSVGVLDPDLPLDRPLMLSDLLMLENRLPDGSPCSMHVEPSPEQGHLVLDEGLFSKPLTRKVGELADTCGHPVAGHASFAYVMGPRTKTALENRIMAKLGVQTNSMTVGPEVVLANELQIPCAGLVVGHKYSIAGSHDRLDHLGIRRSLDTAQAIIAAVAAAFLMSSAAVPFGNRIYTY